MSMVLMKLLTNENDIVRYSYQPESEGEPGVLAYDKSSNTPSIEKLAEKDGESTFYRSHAFAMMRECMDKLPVERLLMWY